MRNTLFLKMFIATLLIFWATSIFAEVTVRDHDIVPEDYFDLISLGNLTVSPDGSLIAYTESRWGEGTEGRKRDLWIINNKGQQSRRLTFDNSGARSLTWAPDSKQLYFLGRDRSGQDNPPRDGSNQVWRLDPTGGSPVAVTRVDGGVDALMLAPDASAIYYMVHQEEKEDEWKSLKNKYSDLEYGHGIKEVNSIRKLDLVSWRDSEILPADRVIWDQTLSPDGKLLAMITTTDNEQIFMEGWSNIEILDLETGKITQVTDQKWRDEHKSPFGWLEDITWSADSGALAFSISYDGYATQLWVAENNGQNWPLHFIKRPHLVTYHGSMQFRGKNRDLCFVGESLGCLRVYEISNVGAKKRNRTKVLTEGEIVVGTFDFDRSGKKLFATIETTTHMNDIFSIKKADKFERLTNVNPQVDTWKLPQIEQVSWTGGDGDKCYGILELPPGYKKSDGPLPTIIEIHGGPTASTKYRLRLWIYGRALMASKGYALLSPNYHGSTGYGDDFLEKLIGRENEIDVTDLTTGAKFLIELGIADPDRMGVMGWSNGGYLTNCMIVAEPNMFKAASSGAGVLDMVIQWGIEDTPGHVINFVEGLPWDHPEHYQASSPLYNLNKVKTPTLIHVGGSDPRVPVAHSKSLYRALRHYLDVPVELVIYPGEPHNLTTHENRLAKMEWDLAWFDKYILGKKTP